MKKILSIMIVLAVITTAVFATDFNLNLGLGGSFNSGKVAKEESSDEDSKLKYGGFDIQVGFNVELNNHLVLYDNVDFVIVGDIKSKYGDEDWVKGTGLDTKFQISEAVGVGYAFHFNAMRLILGGGLHTDFLMFKFKESVGAGTDTQNVNHFGLNILIQGEYMFSEHFGAFVALKPSINFVNSWKFKYPSGSSDKTDGAFGFNGSGVIGATFKF